MALMGFSHGERLPTVPTKRGFKVACAFEVRRGLARERYVVHFVVP